ncbi:hypothetical protein M408DRAFT_100207 [Serendipita vermifera MAFF 305830]|uniref:Uncharacterized protein n=1 Tax=Serendipita vermifera MAFF 305830 TaxID=933852 RepID=A0A0C3AZS9_SERVB|nr:hypothetical protein M408DRAFT_100207 [Serendipita vermifera MAFF 305830]
MIPDELIFGFGGDLGDDNPRSRFFTRPLTRSAERNLPTRTPTFVSFSALAKERAGSIPAPASVATVRWLAGVDSVEGNWSNGRLYPFPYLCLSQISKAYRDLNSQEVSRTPLPV